MLTKNRQILMFLVVIVFPAILLISAFILGFLPYTFLLTSFLTTLATVFTVAALSVGIRYENGGNRPDQAKAAFPEV